MERSVTHHPPEAVLEHLDWVRALARRLCSDPSRAEDVSQEAALAAVRRPPTTDLSMRRWLGGVVRNLARRDRRTHLRREHRETAAARADVVPSTVELLAKVSVERRVVEAVLDLEEPYRTTVLLRYFEGLTPRAIARRTRTPEATVKTRLRRAIALLRRNLDEDFGGDGRSWLLALTPLVPLDPARGTLGAAAVTGGLAVNAKIVALPLAIAAVAGASLWWGTRSIGAPRAAVVETATPAEELVEPPGSLAPLASSRATGDTAKARVEVAAGIDETAIPASPPAPASVVVTKRSLRVIVIDLEDRPVPEVTVQLRGHVGDEGRLTATTDLQGVAAMEVGPMPFRLLVADERYAGLIELHGSVENREEYTLVVGLKRTIEGSVLDEHGAPVPEARVAYAPHFNVRNRLGRVFDRSENLTWNTRADANGNYVLEGVPELPDVLLFGSRFGYGEGKTAVEDHGNQHVNVVLPRLSAEREAVLGIVTDRNGLPREGAWVSMGQASVRTDDEGRFQLPLNGASSGTIVALSEGLLPATYELPEDVAWPDVVELVLDGEPLSIAGRVLDEAGEPLEGVKISLADGTPVGFVPVDVNDPGLTTGGEVEAMLRGDHLEKDVVTKEDGSFVIAGLLDRTYRLFLFNPLTMATTEDTLVRAGEEGLELVLRDPPGLGTLAGRVVSYGGEPLAGVSVTVQRILEDSHRYGVQGDAVVTDEEGRFRFDDILLDGSGLGLFGGPITNFVRHDFEEDYDPLNVEVVIRARCHFLVDLGDRPELATNFQLLDEDGQPMEITSSKAMVSFGFREAWLNEGRSEVLGGPEGPATLVLMKREPGQHGPGEEVLRIPVQLKPGELNRIEL